LDKFAFFHQNNMKKNAPKHTNIPTTRFFLFQIEKKSGKNSKGLDQTTMIFFFFKEKGKKEKNR
jgi:hypothetical protein